MAILSTPTFNAPAQLVKTKADLLFGFTGTEHSLAFCTRSAEDVNGDGLLDQVCHFNTQELNLPPGEVYKGKLILKDKFITAEGDPPLEGSD